VISLQYLYGLDCICYFANVFLSVTFSSEIDVLRPECGLLVMQEGDILVALGAQFSMCNRK